MLYRHSSEMFIQHNEAMRGGKGTVTVKHLLKPDELLGKGRLFAELTVPPGASVGLHRHEGDVEAYYIIEGRGRYLNNEDAYEVNAGDLTLVDDHHSHGIENIGADDLEYIAIVIHTR